MSFSTFRLFLTASLFLLCRQCSRKTLTTETTSRNESGRLSLRCTSYLLRFTINNMNILSLLTIVWSKTSRILRRYYVNSSKCSLLVLTSYSCLVLSTQENKYKFLNYNMMSTKLIFFLFRPLSSCPAAN